MCGIVGYWSRAESAMGLRRALSAAVNSLVHRGPDGQEIWNNELGVGLGHTRLSILDLSESGAQPMACHDAEIVIVFNGEIYNYKEIARDLATKGHVLHGHSDTEVVLAAYREWGLDCVDRFIGMFAFAIWDGQQRCLSLCRDRIGVKPLYYGWDGQTLCFASELKALRALPHWDTQIDNVALGEFLQYGYIVAPRTIYGAIKKLKPGHWLRLHTDGDPEITPYWSLTDVLAQGELEGSSVQLEEELESLLVDAFRYRLVSDVPVGLFLSGGIDSSLVATLLAKSGVSLEAFTIGFDSAEHDESQAATRLARELGLNHHLQRISFSEASEILKMWPDLYDEPFGDHSGIPTYLVSQMARESVKVALSADGGDELFCGYSGYQLLAGRMDMHENTPGYLRRAAGGLMNALAVSPAMNLSNGAASKIHRQLGHGLAYDRIHKLRDFLLAKPGVSAIRPFRTFWQSREVARLIGEPYEDPRHETANGTGQPLEQLTATDLHEYLPDDVLVKVDRAAMAVSLEGREPLLDHRVVEFAFRLPLSQRLGPLGNKHILRSILYRNVPRELVDRPKQGFAVPLEKWMNEWLIRGTVQESIDFLQDKMPWLDTRWLNGQLHAFSGSPQGKNRLWLVYVLGQWANRWV